MIQNIELTILGSTLAIVVNDGSGRIESGLIREVCSSCGTPTCDFDCDGSQGADDNNEEQDTTPRFQYNAILDAVESIILAHACAGINVEQPEYISGIQTALEAAGNNLDY